MWPFKKHKSKTIYKVSYVSCASIVDNVVSFDLKNIDEMFVEAESMLDAQVAFAKKMVLCPHVYVHKIEKVISIET